MPTSQTTALSGLATTTEIPQQDDDDDDWDEGDDSLESDDDGRVYKNPRNSPSTECPRDEEQATLLGQKCLRKCSSDEDCKSKKKKCLCDGVCGNSCIKPGEWSAPVAVARLKRYLAQIASVRSSPSPAWVKSPSPAVTLAHALPMPVPMATMWWVSRVASARPMATGPALSQPASRTVSAGHFNIRIPISITKRTPFAPAVYCLKPPQIEHARNSALPEQETFDLDSTVQYHCYTGYVTNGFPRAKCLAIDNQASWYGPDIQCEREYDILIGSVQFFLLEMQSY